MKEEKVTFEILRKEEITQYKKVIDSCFGKSNDLKFYEQNYKEDGNYIVLVAKIGKNIVGSITIYKIDLFTFSFQPCLEVFNVCVLEEHRGKKIAKMLFEWLVDYAKQNGYQSIYLNCLETAYGAHRLYESFEFEKMGSVKYSLDLGKLKA